MSTISLNSLLPFLPYIIAAIAGSVGVWRKLEKHQQDIQVRSVRMEDRLDRIEKQFGPNGGGLREAVNRISDSIKNIDSKLDEMGKELFTLKGEFEQHTHKKDNNE